MSNELASLVAHQGLELVEAPRFNERQDQLSPIIRVFGVGIERRANFRWRACKAD